MKNREQAQRARAYQKKLKLIQEALDDFPRIIALKARRARERKKFLKATFGDLIKQLEREMIAAGRHS